MIACIDGGDDGDRAMRYAIEEARLRRTGVHLLHVVPDPIMYTAPMTAAATMPDLHERGADIVKDAAQRVAGLAPDLTVRHTIGQGSVIAAVVDASAEASAVVVGSRAWSTTHLFTGSTTGAVAVRAHCPVISVPPRWDQATERGAVLVGVDENAEPAAALRAAFEAADLRQAALVIAHVWNPPPAYERSFDTWEQQSWELGARRHLESLTQPLRDEYAQLPTQILVSFGVKPTGLSAVADKADLLVLGRHRSRARFTHRLGSIAARAVHEGLLPVEIVPVD